MLRRVGRYGLGDLPGVALREQIGAALLVASDVDEVVRLVADATQRPSLKIGSVAWKYVPSLDQPSAAGPATPPGMRCAGSLCP